MFSFIESGPGVATSWSEEVTYQQSGQWRSVILRLIDRIAEDTRRRSDLAPYLVEALHHGIFQLVVLGDEKALMALSDWLQEETLLHQMRKTPPQEPSRSNERPRSHERPRSNELRSNERPRSNEPLRSSYFIADAASLAA